jgi:hypothetical protein
MCERDVGGADAAYIRGLVGELGDGFLAGYLCQVQLRQDFWEVFQDCL